MPTNRKRTSRGRRTPPIAPDEWAFLNDQEPKNPFVALITREKHWQKLWIEHRNAILAGWVAKYPGTRPSFWWKYDAPRDLMQGEDDAGGEPWDELKPRLQIGGAPIDPGTRLDKRGVPMWKCGMLPADPDYPADPPVFETQLAYLKRHGLLLPGEEKRAR